MNNGLKMYLMAGGEGRNEHPMRRPDPEMNYRTYGGDYHEPPHYSEQNGYNEPEDRYRGKDGQWKPGHRRNEYDGRVYDTYPESRRMDDDDEDDMEENVIPFHPENRQIGFGNRDREYETRSHYSHGGNPGRQSARVGGTMWMEPEENEVEMDEVTAEKWVRSMRGEDSSRPSGGRWTMEELKPMAQKFGIKPETPEFFEWYAMTNHFYSKYCAVAKKFNITSPEYYGMMALAWMRDKDAVHNKTAMYYKHCVKK